MIDLSINNVLIPDFDKLIFERACVGIDKGLIVEISKRPLHAEKVIDGDFNYLTPGLIDCHCHIESSHLIPSEFGNEIMKHGTLHAVCDCHEIANVKGRKGLEFFIKNAEDTACNLKFAVPSCVPATKFATSGGRIDVSDVEYFLGFDEVVALGELMNVPAVINKENRFMRMIELAKQYHKRVNGHAPGLTGKTLKKYISAGVEDDHESETYKELEEKIKSGLHVFIREGSAEKSKNSAYKIIEKYPDKVMFCSDDKTIGDIINKGHINYNLKKAVRLGVNPVLSLKTASYNGLIYYGMEEFSEVKKGNRACLVLFDKAFNAKNAVIDGKIMHNRNIKSEIPENFLNSFNIKPVENVPKIGIPDLCISVKNGSLITDRLEVSRNAGEFDIENDMLKLAVFERYGHNNKQAARIKGFGLKKGAIASSFAHDCHNVLSVGISDYAIKKAVNKVIENQGGLALYDGNEIFLLSLKIGGIVSNQDPRKISEQVNLLKNKARELGSSLDDPFAMLSFMALEVIPKLKITDKGLFDVVNFRYVK